MRATLCSLRRNPGAPTRLSVSTKTQPSFLDCRTLPLLSFPSRQRVGLPVQWTRSNNLPSHRSAIRCLPWRGGLHRNPFILWLPQGRECPLVDFFPNQYWMYSDKVTVVFTVEEWFSGEPQKTARLHINKFLGACGYEYHPGDLFFHKGERYLVYAADNNGILSTNHCSKTRHADNKDDAEIESFRRLHRLPSSIVTGTYVLPSVYGPSAPLVGASVTLTSPIGQRFTARTDADGGFTFSGLPPTTYQIQFDSPPGYVVDWAPNSGASWRTSEGIISANPRELVVSPNACRDASYIGLPNGRISGVATSPRGKLPEPIRMRIWPANRVDATENYWWARNETGPTGAFQIGPLLPGSYVVGTYLWPADFKERSKDMNYVLNVVRQPWFYPGTADPAKAKPITLGFAQQISGIHFVLPSASVKLPQKHIASPTTGTQ